MSYGELMSGGTNVLDSSPVPKITELFNFRSEIFTATFFMNLVLAKLKVGKRVKEVLSQVLPASQYSEFKAGNEYFDITVIQPTKNIKISVLQIRM